MQPVHQLELGDGTHDAFPARFVPLPLPRAPPPSRRPHRIIGVRNGAAAREGAGGAAATSRQPTDTDRLRAVPHAA